MLVDPQALKSVLPVEDSFSNTEMRTFSRIRAHQSTCETFYNFVEKNNASNYFAVNSGSGDE